MQSSRFFAHSSISFISQTYEMLQPLMNVLLPYGTPPPLSHLCIFPKLVRGGILQQSMGYGGYRNLVGIGFLLPVRPDWRNRFLGIDSWAP